MASSAFAGYHVFMDEGRAIQLEILRKMTPEQKFRAMNQLFLTARALTASRIRENHPDWSDERVHREVTDAFLYRHE